LEELWPEFLRDGFLDAAGNLRCEYVERDRVDRLVRAMSRAKPALTMHQARRFFQHCRAIEARLRARISTWDAELASFRRLDVAAADAVGTAMHPRKVERVVAGSKFFLRIGIHVWSLDGQVHRDGEAGGAALVAFVKEGLAALERTGIGSGISKGSVEIELEDLKVDQQAFSL